MTMTPTEASKILNNAAQHSKQEIQDALAATDPRQRGMWERMVVRAEGNPAVTGSMKANFAAIRAAMGKEK